MKEKYLNPEQSICASRIFLNTFGLILETISDVNESSRVKIFDKTMAEVGELHFNDDKIIMQANYNNSVLEASYDIPKIFGFVDLEMDNAFFGYWPNKINFCMKVDNGVTLFGEFLIESSIDPEYGISCRCRPLIRYEVPEKGSVFLKMLINGTFSLQFFSENYSETIDIKPFDNLNGFIRHVITDDKYDEKMHKRKYKKSTGVFKGGAIGDNKDTLRLFLNEEEQGVQLSFRNEFIPKVDDDSFEEALKQKGNLMHEIDPDMFDKIKKLRDVLLIGDVSLLDNLISVCYDSYTDEVLIALLGIKREPMNYQDGAENLVASYYGIDKNSCFLSIDAQKKVLKKI